MTTALIFGLIALALIFYGLAAATYIIHDLFSIVVAASDPTDRPDSSQE
jgi:hypothetical protein